MSKSRGSSPNPRKFSEKIALHNKKEAEATAEFEKILKEVGEQTRVSPKSHQNWCPPTRSASFSNRLTCDQQFRSQPNQEHHHYGQQDPNQYYTQPGQFQSVSDQIQQHRQQVVSDIRQQQHCQEQRPRLAVYVDQHGQHQGDYVQQPIGQCNIMQPTSLEVPNIEIFPIDDEYQNQQQHMHVPPSSIPTTVTQDALTNGHYRNDCSNYSISSARSLPNIATLSVSPSTSTNQVMPQQVNNHGLIPPMSNNHLAAAATPATPATTTTMISDNNNDKYFLKSDNEQWCNNEEFCSLPMIQDPMHSMSRQDQNRQHQTHIPRFNSWHQVAVTSAPSSAAPTPPYGHTVQTSPYSEQQHSPQQQVIHSADSSPHRQQHSPQSLQPDYYYSNPQSQNLW
jgi:hypothetical protein